MRCDAMRCNAMRSEAKRSGDIQGGARRLDWGHGQNGRTTRRLGYLGYVRATRSSVWIVGDRGSWIASVAGERGCD